MWTHHRSNSQRSWTDQTADKVCIHQWNRHPLSWSEEDTQSSPSPWGAFTTVTSHSNITEINESVCCAWKYGIWGEETDKWVYEGDTAWGGDWESCRGVCMHSTCQQTAPSAAQVRVCTYLSACVYVVRVCVCAKCISVVGFIFLSFACCVLLCCEVFIFYFFLCPYLSPPI